MTTTNEEKVRDGERTTMNGKPVFNVEAKSIINMKSGFAKKLLCDGPTFSMGDACAYRCSFCYVPSMFTKLDRVADLKKKHGLTHEQMVVRRANALAILKSQLVHPSGKLKFPDPKDTRVIYASPSVDVAANMDLVRETVSACAEILRYTNWQIRLLSKSNLLHKVAELLVDLSRHEAGEIFTEQHVRDRMIFGVSTGTLDDGIAAAFEQDTPNVSARLKSLHRLQDGGFRTFGMICPSLPQESESRYAEFSSRAMEAIRADKCEHVWAEVINVRGDSMVATVLALTRAGFGKEALLLESVSTDSNAWNAYNSQTFHAHAVALSGLNMKPSEKLRYLTYTTKDTLEYWQECANSGAVLL